MKATLSGKPVKLGKPGTLSATSAKLGRVFKLTASTNPATAMSDVVTVVKNVSSNTLSFGFLPPHGVTLTAGESVTLAGDINQYLSTGGRPNARKLAAFNAAVSNKLIRVFVNKREIVHCSVASGSTIAVGDLVFLDVGAGNVVKSAADFTWDTNIATTQAGFANVFVGVALDAHVPAAGAIITFRVDVSPDSFYAYTCTSETHVIGDTFGPAKASGNALLPQQLVKATATSSIARGREQNASAATSVIVQFQSAYRGFNAQGSQ